MNRYQHQTRLVRLGRWLHWKPMYALKAVFVLGCWVLSGARISAEETELFGTSRWFYAKHTWFFCMCLANCKMRHTYTIDEIITELGNP